MAGETVKPGLKTARYSFQWVDYPDAGRWRVVLCGLMTLYTFQGGMIDRPSTGPHWPVGVGRGV